MTPILFYNHGSLARREYLHSQVLPLIDAITRTRDVVLATSDSETELLECPVAARLGMSTNRRFSFVSLSTALTSHVAALSRLIRSRSIRHAFVCTPSQALLVAGIRSAIARNLRIVLWYQGAEPEEVDAGGGGALRVAGYNLVECLALRASDSVLVVSSPMQDHLVAKYPRTRLAPKLVVSPNCVAVFPELTGIERVPLSIAYVGSVVAWQRFDYITAMFREIAALEPNARFAVFTNDPDAAAQAVGGMLADRIVVTRLPSCDVPAAMARYQLGVIVRDRQLFNRVAAPIKIGEYLAAGARVIATEGIGDYSTWIATYDLGVIIRGDSASADARRVVASFATSSRPPSDVQEFARSRFSVEQRARLVLEGM